MILCTQGYELKIKVSSNECRFVASDGLNKIVLYDVLQDGDEFFIIASAETTKDWHAGRWNYQILGAEGIEEQNILKVMPNLEFSNDTITSYWRRVLNAIDDRLAGRATNDADSVTVGDKNLHYMSVSQLLALRNFVLQRIAEEEKTEGVETVSPNDQRRILYKWGQL